VNLELFDIDDSVIRLIPRDVADKYSVLPLSRVGATLTLAMVDPTNVFAMDDIKFMTGLNIEPVVVSEASVQEAISRYYSQSREIELARDFEESQNSNTHSESLPESGMTLDSLGLDATKPRGLRSLTRTRRLTSRT
jgi:type IV pilus assembly protein PilB